MKLKSFLCSLCMLCCVVVNAQLVQASLGEGAAANYVKIYLKQTVASANLSTLQFNLGIQTALMNKPTLSIVSSALPGVSWVVSEATEGGYYNFQITTSTSPIEYTATANTAFEVLEVSFSAPVTSSDVELVSLPDGGLGTSNGQSLFLATGNPFSKGNDIYFALPGVAVSNENSYDAEAGAPGVTTSTARITGVVLPVTWLSFSASKNNENVDLKWQVTNQVNVSSYDVEVSKDGLAFSRLSELKTNTSGTYQFTHIGGGKWKIPTVYYRIKQLDKDGKYVYSAVRKIILSNHFFKVVIVENPVKGSIVNALIESTDKGIGRLVITDMTGKTVFAKTISWSVGRVTIPIDLSAHPPGSYVLSLINDQHKQQVIFVK